MKIFFALIFCFAYGISAQSLIQRIDSLNTYAFSKRGTNPIETIKKASIALELADSINYTKGKCISYSFIGVGYRNLSYFKQALENYQKGLEIADSLNDYEQLSFAYNNIGNLFLKSGNDSLAMIYLNKAFELAKDQNNLVLLGYAYKNIGGVYFSKGNYDSALTNLNLSFEVRKKINDNWGATNTLAEIGNLYRTIKEYENAINTFNIALIEASRLQHNDILLAEIYQLLAQTFYDREEYLKAAETISKSLILYESINSKVDLLAVYELNSKINYKLGRFETAYNCLINFNLMNDSLKTINAEKQLELLELIYTTEQLKKDNNINELKLSRAELLRNFLLSMLILVLIASAFIYISYKNKKKANLLLVAKNDQIVGQKLELTKINATKDKLFSIIAHDLKNPFAHLINSTQLILTELDRLTKGELRDLVESVHKSSKNSYRLLENLLLWAQSQKGEINYKPELFNLIELLNRNILLYSETAKSKNIKLSLQTSSSNCQVFSDYNMIDSVTRNLLNNAIKFSYENGDVKINLKEEKDYVIISISDNGIGMDNEQLENLFSIENKSVQYGTKGEKGTGIGLLLCKEFIEKNNSEIFVDSSLGIGTTISFTLKREE